MQQYIFKDAPVRRIGLEQTTNSGFTGNPFRCRHKHLRQTKKTEKISANVEVDAAGKYLP